LVPLWIRLNTRVGESEFVRIALACIVLHYIRVKVLLFYTVQLSNIFCAAVTAQQVPLTRALDGAVYQRMMVWGFFFEQFITCQLSAVPIFGGT
jgi:hypothetical protein